MFRGGQPNAYDEIVAKTTDENLTGENWELILNLCDKVQEEGEQGARNVIAASLKRLAHRNPNVQLYTLALVEALSKNCGIEVHREIASRAFTQGLEKLVTDRTTHDKVRKRVLSSVATWTAEFEKDPTLGLMEECYETLKGKGYKFVTPDEPPPPDVDDDVRRREEEELQRALEISMQDKGGRSQWEAYSLASSSGASGSGAGGSRQGASATPGPSGSSSRPAQSSTQVPTYGGYVPSQATPAVSAVTQPTSIPSAATNAPPASSSPVSVHSTQDNIPIVTRVRALHTFEPSEPGELAFEKGDIIKVVDRNYKDWWRGQLKGRTGIFPVNYVEPLPEPTAAEIAREAEQEAAVFSQAANVDKLLTMLRTMDPARDNLADNEEIQELYRSCMSLRPKIVKLIDKYSQKRADLVSMNETFVKARTIFDRMMEDSLARHTGVYDGRPPYVQAPSQSYIARPDSRARQEYLPPGGPQVAPGAPQAYGWNPNVYEQPGYNAYPASPAAYPPENQYPPPVQPHPPAQPQQYGDPNAYGARQQSVYGQPPAQGYPGATPYAPTQEPQGYPGGPAMQPQSQQPLQHHQPQQPLQPQQPQQPHQPQQPFQPQQVQQAYSPQQQAQPAPQPQAEPAPQPQYQPQAQPQIQPHAQPQVQPQVQAEPQSQPQAQAQPEPQQQSQPQEQPQESAPTPTQQQSGPPYVYDPNGTYADPNAQAWAQYYAHGGTDPTGAVYFISVPGVKEGPPAPVAHHPAVARTQSSDSIGQAATPVEQTQLVQVAPLHIQKQSAPDGQVAQQPHVAVGQPGVYGASPYAPEGLGSPGAGAGQPAPGQQFYGLPTQFAGMDISANGEHSAPAGPQGVGAPA
ncbi:uncharacterized protein TRAVEDRAFT_58676 [Trametes versicolor FP-101664 SS1]|uniref:uncharacterized protein n=1 Tax=Trametes versicolor (strain FP-101664) TaxID=717944 RepID=UPI0004623E0D|nr:uncharacterized protein TRAVEDRAFT_58676 [Trametes versicolor FP-101664 SS1]EIW58405.1 hypothetical protein TRAVEDRAFT_58676 [Trametes versicolor FP-101664 SS1]